MASSQTTTASVEPNSKVPPVVFSHGPPFLAIVTERSGCDNEETLASMLEKLRNVTHSFSGQRQQQKHGGGGVDLISVRMSLPTKSEHRPERKERVVRLLRQLLEWSDAAASSKSGNNKNNKNSNSRNFRVVTSSDWIDAALEAGADGVHFKETHRHLIPQFRRQYSDLHQRPTTPIVGTSTHSVDSALDAWEKYQPDYFFVGTCYVSNSHPEKTEADLEGPELPGIVRNRLQALVNQGGSGMSPPPVLAIGGIDASNCRVPMEYGAEGVAVIRAVFSDPDPSQAVSSLRTNINIR